MNNSECDSQSGVCPAPALDAVGQDGPSASPRSEVIYVGDPMCSWCWGLSPALDKLQQHCRHEGMAFRVVVGGLRPGGGDPWNAQFRQFLRHHWQQIGQRSGQPFSYRLLDLEFFDYDTEPACRAVVAARALLGERELAFFEAVQRKFYVDNEDPKESRFYESICRQFALDFTGFVQRWSSQAVKSQTTAEFQLNRSWGVQGYPSVLLRQGTTLMTIATGFCTFDEMMQRIAATIA